MSRLGDRRWLAYGVAIAAIGGALALFYASLRPPGSFAPATFALGAVLLMSAGVAAGTTLPFAKSPNPDRDLAAPPRDGTERSAGDGPHGDGAVGC